MVQTYTKYVSKTFLTHSAKFTAATDWSRQRQLSLCRNCCVNEDISDVTDGIVTIGLADPKSHNWKVSPSNGEYVTYAILRSCGSKIAYASKQCLGLNSGFQTKCTYLYISERMIDIFDAIKVIVRWISIRIAFEMTLFTSSLGNHYHSISHDFSALPTGLTILRTVSIKLSSN